MLGHQVPSALAAVAPPISITEVNFVGADRGHLSGTCFAIVRRTMKLNFFQPLLLSALFLAACPGGDDSRHNNDGGNGGNDAGNNPAPGRLPDDTRAHSASGNSWTLLVYMVADNNLEPFALQDVAEMAAVGSSNSLNIIVQIDRAEGYTSDELVGLPDFSGVKRLKVEQGRVEVLSDLGELNMGERSTLSDFLSWGLRAYPADRVGLVLWDHGGAWPGFGGDESTQDLDVLNLAELRQGIADGLTGGGKDQLAFIGFDACLMATYETALSLRSFAEYLIASEQLEPGHGWDYHSLAKVANDPSTSPKDLGQEFLHGFIAQANAEQTADDVTLALIDLHEVAKLSNSIADLADALKGKATSSGPELGQIRADVLEFGKAPDASRSTNMVDLADLASRAAGSDQSLKTLETNMMNALHGTVLAMENGPVNAKAGGLSIYYPPQAEYYRADYDHVEGVDAWRGFIKGYNTAGQSAGEAPAFTNADHAADVALDGSDVVVSGQLAEGAEQDVAEATLTFGIYDQDSQSAILLGQQPADVVGTSVEARWDGSFLKISQNGVDAVGFYTVDISENRLSTSIPFGYIAPGSMNMDYVLLTYTLNLETGEEQTTYYLITDGGPGELLPEAGSELYPLVLVANAQGASWQTSVTSPFDGGAAIDLALQPVPSGTTVFLELDVQNFGGQSDYVAFTGTM